MIPADSVILLAGIPATGKSRFAEYLAKEHGFAHYNMEQYPTGWPEPQLHECWNSSRKSFVAKLREQHRRSVLDWGFPPACLPWIRELEAEGVRLVWFAGDVSEARRVFERRGGISLAAFDHQVKVAKEAGFPESLGCTVLPALATSGAFLSPQEIEAIVFQ